MLGVCYSTGLMFVLYYVDGCFRVRSVLRWNACWWSPQQCVYVSAVCILNSQEQPQTSHPVMTALPYKYKLHLIWRGHF